VIDYRICQPGLVFNLQIKPLEEKNPLNEARLRIGFLHEVLQSGMISENYDLRIDQIGSELSQGKHYR